MSSVRFARDVALILGGLLMVVGGGPAARAGDPQIVLDSGPAGGLLRSGGAGEIKHYEFASRVSSQEPGVVWLTGEWASAYPGHAKLRSGHVRVQRLGRGGNPGSWIGSLGGGEGPGITIAPFRLLPNTRYVVEVRGASPGGSFVVGASRLTLLSVGRPTEGNISTGGALDWYQLRVQEPGDFLFHTSAGTLRNAKMDLYRKESPNTGRLARDDNGGAGNMPFFWRSLQPGNHYLMVRGADAQQTGTYRVVVAPRARLFAGTVGSIDQADEEDWYPFSKGPAGSHLMVFEVSNAWGGSLRASNLTLFGNDLEVRGKNGQGGDRKLSRIVLNVARGEYYLRVQGAGGATGSYRLPASYVTDLGVNRGPHAASIDVPGEHDWYRVNIAKAGAHRIEATPTGPRGLHLFVYRPDHDEPIARDVDGGACLLPTQPMKTGTYYLRVRGDTAGMTGQYRVSVARTRIVRPPGPGR